MAAFLDRSLAEQRATRGIDGQRERAARGTASAVGIADVQDAAAPWSLTVGAQNGRAPMVSVPARLGQVVHSSSEAPSAVTVTDLSPERLHTFAG